MVNVAPHDLPGSHDAQMDEDEHEPVCSPVQKSLLTTDFQPFMAAGDDRNLAFILPGIHFKRDEWLSDRWVAADGFGCRKALSIPRW